MRYFKTALILLICVPLSFAQLPQPASITFTNLTGLGRVHGVNRTNMIVGHTVGGDNVQGFVLQNGAITDILVPGSIQTLIFGVENNGRVVGAYYKSDHSGAHGFLYFNGNVTTIDFPGANSTMAHGINDPQRIVGEFRDNAGYSHGFLYDRGNFTRIDISGAVNTYAEGINNPGDVVGYFTDNSGHQHGFLYDKNGTITTIDVPFAGVTDTLLYGINSLGVIVGAYVDSAGTHGFLDVSGIFTGFDAPGTPPSVGTFAYGISDNGQIAVFGATAFLGLLGS
ncbi:MAG TPA: hypothetical protein VFB14_01370 [Bryobacteraceae bacterium]|nr:hypothetical protein [Bryobacteraceae bacterium]